MTKDPGRRVRGIIFSTITIVAGLSLLVYLIWQLRPLILPIIIGILLAYLFRPLKTAFKYKWLPNGVRIALLLSLVTGALLGTVKFIKASLPNEKEKLELLVRMKYKFNERFEKMMGLDPMSGKGNGLYNLIGTDINPIRESLNHALDLKPEQVEQFMRYRHGADGFEPVPEKYYQYFLVNSNREEIAEAQAKSGMDAPAAAAPAEKKSLVKTLIGVLSMWVLMPVVFIFFLLDEGAISQFFVRMVPNRYFELALTVLEEVDNAIGKYLRGLSMECGLVAVTMSLGLLVVGFPLQIAAMIAILAGIATSIPLVGPVVGFSLGLTYALIAESINPLLPFIDMENLFAAVLVVNAIVMALDNTVFQPIVLGSAVNLHPLVVILGIMSASMMFGPAGVLLAIPTIVVAKAVIQHTFRGLKDYRII